MNLKRLLITILVMFVTVWATDYLIHGVWLAPIYGATKELWRPEPEMLSRMPLMLLGQFIIATGFTVLFALFVAEKRCLKFTLIYALLIGIMTGGGQIIMFVVQPYPADLVVKWCIAYLVQALLMGLIVHLVYRPAPGANCCQTANH